MVVDTTEVVKDGSLQQIKSGNLPTKINNIWLALILTLHLTEN